MDDILLNQEFAVIAAIENNEITGDNLKQLAKETIADNARLFKDNQYLLTELYKMQYQLYLMNGFTQGILYVQ